MNHTQKAEQQLLEIAMRNIPPVADRGDLKTRNSDSEDFLNIAVWGIQTALREAYELGKMDAQNETKTEVQP